MGFTRWFFYGDSSHASREAKARIDSGESDRKLERFVGNQEDRTAARKAKRKAARREHKGFFYWE